MIGRVFRTTILLSRAHSALPRRACLLSTSPLPEEAQEAHFKYLRNSRNGAELFLVGTCHASSGSANSVKEMIRVIKPSAVALELCEGRAQHLRSEGQVQSFSLPDFLNLPGSFGQKAASQAILDFQGLLKLFGINYGEEFRVALEEGEKIGADLHYIDRDMDVTLQEVKKHLSFCEVINFIRGSKEHASRYPALYQSFTRIESIEDVMRNKIVLQQMFQLSEDHFPGALKAILHDRNEFMIKQLRDMKGKIIVVVGLAHVEGMEKLWREAEP